MGVDETGGNDESGHIYVFHIGRAKILTQGGHLPVMNQQIGPLLTVRCGIDDPATLQQKGTMGRWGVRPAVVLLYEL